MTHKLPLLPYTTDALQPYISKETVEYHHDKHQRAYVEKLNELIGGTEFATASLKDIVLRASGDIFNNAAQAWNHDFYWQCLSPRGGGQPGGEIGRDIRAAFGTFPAFKQKFSELAGSTFGSGWVWLVRTQAGSLALVSTSNANNPMTEGQIPLLTCDVWEHAYYLDYQNEREKYVEAVLDHLLNWEFAAENLARVRRHELAKCPRLVRLRRCSLRRRRPR
jgi:Fe-Mn family superoxide dismutase